MSKSYIALMHRPEATSYWGVTFPDFPGCVSAGATFEEAFANAREALAGHVAAMRADGEAIPEPSTYDAAILDAVFAEEIASGALPVFVDLVNVPAPKERINIMMDRGTLRQVDEAARAEGISRSAYIERAAASWSSSPFRGSLELTLGHIHEMLQDIKLPPIVDSSTAANDGPRERKKA